MAMGGTVMQEQTRRDLLWKGGIASAALIIPAVTGFAVPAKAGEKEEVEVSPTEDLMREHRAAEPCVADLRGVGATAEGQGQTRP